MDPPPPYTPLPEQGSNVGGCPQQSPRPPLPPRSSLQPTPVAATPHQDLRSASQVSLVPIRDATKRTLLVIYIHGFMGNETSFQSFPAHLHNLLCVTLEPLGYLVHTKVYPKFKTRYNILVATGNFSQWLSQFENENTDVVLLGHSMGGLLSADVALLKDYTGLRRHRLLGTISFDTPFLGMHPGVITAGLGSLFRPAPKSPGEDAESLYQNGGESSTSLHTMNSGGSQVDEFYSKKPQRNYTVAIPKKEGTWDSTFHFINKYHSRLTQATGQYLMSHLEFGGCLADPVGLKNRYLAIRALEDGLPTPDGGVARVRFVNYYTSSTGRTREAPKPPPTATISDRAFDDYSVPITDTAFAKEVQAMRMDNGSSSGHRKTLSASSYNTASSYGEMRDVPADPIDDDELYSDLIALHIVETDDIPVADGKPPSDLPTNEKIPFDDGEGEEGEKLSSEIARENIVELGDTNEEVALPPIPPPPEEPSTFDYSVIPDPIVRKVAEKEAARVRRRYEKAVKDHAKLVRDRERMLEKLERRKGKEVEREVRTRGKEEKCKVKEKEKEEKNRLKELRDKEKELERVDKDKLRELGDLEKKMQKEDKARTKELRDWEREKELQQLDNEIEARERQRELKEWEREKDQQRKEESKSGKGKQENSHEKQELERLRKEQERMDAEYRRMNGIPEPPLSEPLSPKNATPSATPSASSSRSHLPLSQLGYIPPFVPSPKSSPQPKQKKKREHRFCMLPSDKNDKCWVKVEMQGVDEVGAHCGLFFVGEVYERLVGDVAARIEEWVSEDVSGKAIEQAGKDQWGGDEKRGWGGR